MGSSSSRGSNNSSSSSSLNGNDVGYCLYYETCYSGYTRSQCNSAGGTFSKDRCQTEEKGYCVASGICYRGYTQSECNSDGGTFNKNSCPANPALPSNGQYCYDGYDCDLIGTSASCLFFDADDCTEYRGTVKTLEWCYENVGVTAGCVW